jgi:hypothetical protein
MTPNILDAIRTGLKHRLDAQDGKPITLSARANAVMGRVPG